MCKYYDCLHQTVSRKGEVKGVHEPSVMSSTSPLSPKHWAKRHWFDGAS